MELLADYGIVITTYESNQDERSPIITHISWGDSLEQALRYMHSHLISDFFLSSTFGGSMLWRDKRLKLTYNIEIISLQVLSRKEKITKEIIDKVKERADETLMNQYANNIDNIINHISKMEM